MGEPVTKPYQNGVCGLVCVTLGVLDVKKIESPCKKHCAEIPNDKERPSPKC